MVLLLSTPVNSGAFSSICNGDDAAIAVDAGLVVLESLVRGVVWHPVIIKARATNPVVVIF